MRAQRGPPRRAKRGWDREGTLWRHPAICTPRLLLDQNMSSRRDCGKKSLRSAIQTQATGRGKEAHGAMITLAPSGGSEPTPSISEPTAASHPSSCLSRAAAVPVYQEFAWVASRVDMAPSWIGGIGEGGDWGGGGWSLIYLSRNGGVAAWHLPDKASIWTSRRGPEGRLCHRTIYSRARDLEPGEPAHRQACLRMPLR